MTCLNCNDYFQYEIKDPETAHARKIKMTDQDDNELTSDGLSTHVLPAHYFAIEAAPIYNTRYMYRVLTTFLTYRKNQMYGVT